MNKINYQLEMEKIIEKHCNNRVPTLLLHSCCAPCSSYCLQYLANYFEITVLYYNPNIYPPEEYYMRAAEQERFIREFPVKNPVHFVEGAYDTERFYEAVRGLEKVKEGNERCFVCYELRLSEAAKFAKENHFDFFTTTLSISPLKNSEKLNEIGQKLELEFGVNYLYSDFKKKDGYKKSTIISNEYNMYRQYYCGCVYSKNQRDQEILEKSNQEKKNE